MAHAVGGSFVTDHWGSTRTIILDQEVELVEGGRFLLRLRLWPFHEFGLTFRTCSLTEAQATIDSGAPGLLLFARDSSEDAATP